MTADEQNDIARMPPKRSGASSNGLIAVVGFCLLILSGVAGYEWFANRYEVNANTAMPVEGTSGDVPTWRLRSHHFIYGMPEITHRRHNFVPDGGEDEQPGISVLVREGFVIGHLDRFKTPLWVAMRWTTDDLERSLAESAMPRNFRADPELPEYARAMPNYQGSVTGYDRGHIARHADNRAWGRRNSDAGNLMSNIAPQSVSLNRHAWLSIENAHRFVVSNDPGNEIDTVWIISGCVFEGETPVEFIANEVAVPQSTFKVIAWFANDGEFHARGYNVPQEASIRDPKLYLTPIREIEELTGLNFFPELDEAEQDRIETAVFENIWNEVGQ